MIVENLTGQAVPPERMAGYAMKVGARVSGGTDMNILARALAKDYGLQFAITSDENVLVKHLQAGEWQLPMSVEIGPDT